MKKILIIEDNTDINNMTAEALRLAGYACTQAFSGTEGRLLMERDEFALVILDLMLPGLHGEALLPQLKSIRDVPVIVVSAKDSLDSKVNLLTGGAEDYLTKPFDIEELVARVGVQIRRFARADEAEAHRLTYKDMVLNRDDFSVTVSGCPVTVTKQEYKILELFLSFPKRAFSKQEIYDYAWDDIYLGEDKTINVHISNIRRKLKAVTETEYIETVWGIGFRLAR